MKKRYEALGRASQKLSMPLEYAAGLPKVEMEGFTTVRVESHRGVLQYSGETVELGGKGVRIRVSGSGLGLKSLSPALAVICGQIRGVEYIFGEDGA